MSAQDTTVETPETSPATGQPVAETPEPTPEVTPTPAVETPPAVDPTPVTEPTPTVSEQLYRLRVVVEGAQSEITSPALSKTEADEQLATLSHCVQDQTQAASLPWISVRAGVVWSIALEEV